MRITAIKQDANGFKLIAAIKVFNQPKCKPFNGNAHFFDYKDGILRMFNASTHESINVATYKAALKHILSM